MSNPVGKKDCCDSCRSHRRKSGGMYCLKPTCPCHIGHTVDNWEEKLKESDVYKRIMAIESVAFVHGARPYEGQTLTEFIRELLETQRKSLLEEVKREVPLDDHQLDVLSRLSEKQK